MFYEQTISHLGSKSTPSLSKIFIAPSSIILSGIALTALFPNQPLLNLSWMLFVLLTATGLCIYLYRKNRITFIKIDDECISLFDDVTNEHHSVKIDEIIAVNTKFCSVRIYTKAEVYALNMSLISKEKQRWEIKETIRKVVPTTNLLLSATG